MKPGPIKLLEQSIPETWPEVTWKPVWSRRLTRFWKKELESGTSEALLTQVALALGSYSKRRYIDYNLAYQNWVLRQKQRPQTSGYSRPQRTEARGNREDFKGGW